MVQGQQNLQFYTTIVHIANVQNFAFLGQSAEISNVSTLNHLKA